MKPIDAMVIYYPNEACDSCKGVEKFQCWRLLEQPFSSDKFDSPCSKADWEICPLNQNRRIIN